jgi:hypothetical protein
MRSARWGGVAAVMLVAAGCGGSDSGFVDPMNEAGLNDAERQALASQLMSAASGVASSSRRSAQGAPAGDALAGVGYSSPLNSAVACAVSGRMSYTGNISGDVNATTGYWTMYGAITFRYGDATNNLNDCQVASGLYADGSLLFTMSGNSTDGVGWSITGTITAANKGPTGGLVPRGSCRVFLNQAKGAAKATGTVCGYSVS